MYMNIYCVVLGGFSTPCSFSNWVCLL